MKPFAVVIAGGGTGGHLYPGIAVAREVRRRLPDAQVTFAGTTRGLEARVVPREGFPLDVIRSAGLKGKSMRARLRGAALVPLGLIDAFRILSRRRPQVVIGVGGYSSGPVVLAAAWRGIPTMVLEQNAVPGLTNRLLAPWVRAGAVTYDATLPFFRGKGFVSGNPVRAEFFDAVSGASGAGSSGHVSGGHGAPAPERLSRVLILGGSQGAHVINVAMSAAAPALARQTTPLTIVHQTGDRDLAVVRDAYAAATLTARVEPFLDGVADEMRAADLVICRAGATTLAELAASGRPAVLVPFAAAADDHQRKNAQVLADAGAAVLIEERALSADAIVAALETFAQDPARLDAMGRAMRAFARPDAAARIVDRLLALGGATSASTAEVRA